MNMKEIPKRFASAEQKLRLVQLVESDPQLKSGRFSQSFPINEANKRWLAISHELNAIPGTKKTWREWRKTWQDKKANAKKKSALHRQSKIKSDSSAAPEHPTLADCLILQMNDQSPMVGGGVVGTERQKKFASSEQRQRLLRLMEANPQLKSGKYSTAFSHFEAKRKWIAISHILNSMPGAKKTWEEWRKTWQDRKANTKKKNANLNKQSNSAGSLPPETTDDSLVLQTNDWQTSMEHNYYQESKPILIDLPRAGTSKQHTDSPPSLGTHGSSDVRSKADTERLSASSSDDGLNAAEALTIGLLREKLEVKKKFYEDYIELMRKQTQALVDIAGALNDAAAMSDVANSYKK